MIEFDDTSPSDALETSRTGRSKLKVAARLPDGQTDPLSQRVMISKTCHSARGVGAALLFVLLTACQPTAGGRQSVSSPPDGRALVLLANNDLDSLSLSNGAIPSSIHLGPAYMGPRGVEHVMAIDSTTGLLIALVRSALPERSQVAAVDIGTLRVKRVGMIDIADVIYRSLAIGRQTHRIYLFGNRVVGPDRGPTLGQPSDAVVTILDGDSLTVVHNWTLRQSGGRDWFVYSAAVNDEENRMYVSYHGPDTTGLDTFNFTDKGFEACHAPNPSLSCVDGHGNFKFYDGNLLFATGGPEVREIDLDGKVLRSYDTLLENDHLMEFSVDPVAKRMYAVGSCGYVPGLTSVDVNTGRAVHLGPKNAEMCGENLVSAHGLLLVQRLSIPSPPPSRSIGVMFVDESTGNVVRNVAMPSSPVDLVMAS